MSLTFPYFGCYTSGKCLLVSNLTTLLISSPFSYLTSLHMIAKFWVLPFGSFSLHQFSLRICCLRCQKIYSSEWVISNWPLWCLGNSHPDLYSVFFPSLAFLHSFTSFDMSFLSFWLSLTLKVTQLSIAWFHVLASLPFHLFRLHLPILCYGHYCHIKRKELGTNSPSCLACIFLNNVISF